MTDRCGLPVSDKTCGGADECLIDVGVVRLNSMLVPAVSPDLPPIVFLHGASASLHDQAMAFRGKLEGRARLLFVDRPGHGFSHTGTPAMILPDRQADAIARLMEQRGIGRAIIVGHSFGGAIAAALAVNHPHKVAGLLMLAPALYPWPGGVAWYYTVASLPLAGPLFSVLIVPFFGRLVIDAATRSVFAPNSPPRDYLAQAHAFEALRPQAFRHNAREVVALQNWVRQFSPRFAAITAPAVIIAGDADRVVSPVLHARRFAQALKNAELVSVTNLGHKPDHIATDLAIAALEKIAGQPRDLQAEVLALEQRIAGDTFS